MNTLKILLAEDNLADVLLVRKALEEYQVPYDLHVVRDGEEALTFIQVWANRMVPLSRYRAPGCELTQG